MIFQENCRGKKERDGLGAERWHRFVGDNNLNQFENYNTAIYKEKRSRNILFLVSFLTATSVLPREASENTVNALDMMNKNTKRNQTNKQKSQTVFLSAQLHNQLPKKRREEDFSVHLFEFADGHSTSSG